VFYEVLGKVGRIVGCSGNILVFLELCGIQHKTVSVPHAESITTVTITTDGTRFYSDPRLQYMNVLVLHEVSNTRITL